MTPGSACPLPTPTEKHYRDLLLTVEARLRSLDGRGSGMVEVQREVKRIADLIRANLDREATE